MLLAKIKDYLRQVKVANLTMIGQHLNVAPDIVQDMLQHWIRKGCVRCVTPTQYCRQACQQCPSATQELYEWINKGDFSEQRRRSAISVLTYCHR